MKAQILAERLKKLAAEQGEDLSLVRFCGLARVSTSTVYRYYPGGWPELRAAAGLGTRREKRKRFSDEELLAPIGRLMLRGWRPPRWNEVAKKLPASLSTYERRFGSLTGVLRAYRARYGGRGMKGAVEGGSGGRGERGTCCCNTGATIQKGHNRTIQGKPGTLCDFNCCCYRCCCCCCNPMYNPFYNCCYKAGSA